MTRPIDQAWNLQQRWSSAANAAHDTIGRARRANLALLVAAAIAGAIGGVAHETTAVVRTMAVLSATLLGSAGVLQQRVLARANVGRWVALRTASETLKAAVWHDLALGRADDDAAGAAISALIDEVQAGTAPFADALLAPVAAAKPLPDVADLAGYRVRRADSQAGWHRDKATTLLQTARRLRNAELLGTIAGVAVSAAAATFASSVLTPIVSALTTVAATIAAHLSAAKYERVAAGYAATTIALERAGELLVSNPNEAETSAFVGAVEAILTRQNDAWLTLLSED